MGVEITDDAVELPRFRHPSRAAYVFGAERYSLSPQMLAKCEFVVKIPTRFSINVGMAGAIVLYDRMMSQCGYDAARDAVGAANPCRPGIAGARHCRSRATIKGWKRAAALPYNRFACPPPP